MISKSQSYHEAGVLRLDMARYWEKRERHIGDIWYMCVRFVETVRKLGLR